MKKYHSHRRSGLARLGITAIGAGLALTLAACSGVEDGSANAGVSEDNELLEKYDVAIPTTDLKMGLMPYGDHMSMVIAYENNWFEEAGIQVDDKRATFDLDQLQGLMINRTFDIATNYIPDQLRNAQGSPDVNFLGIVDITSGTGVLAAPDSNLKTIESELEAGASWDDAVATVMNQMVGKRFGMEDVGAHRGFIDTVMDEGGISFDDLGEFQTSKDPQLVLMARGDKLDFVLPQGGAIEAKLITEGWYPIIQQHDLIENLPAGSPEAISGVGNVGLSINEKFYEENPDAALRIAGVMFRTIDAVIEDVNSDTTDNVSLVAPVLSATTSVEITPEEVLSIYRDVGPFISFEDQADVWANEDSPLYYKTVYNLQIERAREAGVITDPDLAAEDLAGIAEEVYIEMSRLKSEYEELVKEAGDLTGEQKELAEIAAKHYENRNYLDAQRILSAALNS
ncbi:NMT1-like family protein [Paramicrobacterium humi]|uniref:NMT1-like family protein n=1 Tax=Paramicrobacterium humi TaxID=640635 RepID=A0A1H4K8D4_9MICO|nr:ABC transporter substrate-binding protein [Microbacterium humi]SEB54819.1 NMT1-like family protein [Microbacterium humi]